ncbi:zinc ABC transporter substrate-binding protein [Candidatus Saccharibacteria bacterium]|nr:zinc ABC transporter substrate-binding protein [Candidatus Saccharibacteria bacterium]
MEEKENFKSNIKAIVAAVLVAGILLGGFFLVRFLMHPREYTKIIVSNFAAYDIARAVMGDASKITMLVEPGKNPHEYEPSEDAIKAIESADLFIYFGGESESWISKIKGAEEGYEEGLVKLSNFTALRVKGKAESKEEEPKTYQGNYYQYGSEEPFDDHIWTSLTNAITLTHVLADRLSQIYPENREKYYENAQKYTTRLNDIDQKLRRIVMYGNKKPLVFADRFLFQYLVSEYGIDYYAALPNCDGKTEITDDAVNQLIEKVKKEDLKVVLKTEMSSGKYAKTVADATGTKVMELNAAHIISAQDFNAGVTLADIMEKNAEVIKEALDSHDPLEQQ